MIDYIYNNVSTIQAPPAAAAPAAPAAPASGPYELSFLDKQLKFESEADGEAILIVMETNKLL